MSVATTSAGAPAWDPLIPSDEEMFAFDGTRGVEDFKSVGNGWMRGYLIPQGRIQPDSAVLDVGCGIGKLAWALSSYLSPSGRYCGFDIQENVIAWCRTHYASLPNFEFDFVDLKSDHYNENGGARAENHTFPYDDDAFDIVFAGSLFTHLEPAASENYFAQTARSLKPGGRLVFSCTIINEHNLGIPANNVERRREYRRASPVHHLLDPARPSRAVAYDESALRRMVAGAGLIVSTILFGRWSNSQAVTPGFQDCIVALKPR